MARFSPPSPTPSSSPSFSYFILISSLLYGANIKSTALLVRLFLFSLPVDLSPGFGYLAGAAMLFRLQIGPGGLKEKEEDQQLPKNVINSVLGRREA